MTGHNIDLYEHQKLAIEQLTSGKILCAGVGTGKSRTALAYFYIKECGGSFPINGEGEYKPREKEIPLYIITTAKKRDSREWEAECIPFLLNENVVVDSWNNIHKYIDISNAFFIFDEQRVVGYGAWVKAFLKIARNNRWILLSATPGDTWLDYAPVFIANGFYRNRTEFIRRHVIQSAYVKYFKVERYVDVARLISLKEMVLVNMDYIKPTQEHHEYIYCNYDKLKYSIVANDRWDIYENRPIKNISGMCSLLRKVCNADPSRAAEVKRLLNEHPKVIIYYNFDYELDILRAIAKQTETPVAELNGHNHQDIPNESHWMYLVQYASGAEAWNCIETNAMIFYSQSYSWKMMEQASGRISRLNTPFSDLYYYHLSSKSGIDKSIERCLKNKKQFNEKRYGKQLGLDFNDDPVLS